MSPLRSCHFFLNRLMLRKLHICLSCFVLMTPHSPSGLPFPNSPCRSNAGRAFSVCTQTLWNHLPLLVGPSPISLLFFSLSFYLNSFGLITFLLILWIPYVLMFVLFICYSCLSFVQHFGQLSCCF